MPSTDKSGLALDTAFFTYKPLSNLPTPPPSYRDHSAGASPRCDGAWDGKGQLANHYRGPAIHLVNLIPSAASLVDASASLVQTILTRAGLPLETVALAACILDSLNSRFARKWRLTCPLRTSSPAGSPCPDTPTTKRHSLPSAEAAPKTRSRDRAPQLHIDSVSPEVIVLAAVVIAVKFTEDPEQASFFYCQDWGLDIWSSEQLNASERCIMENLNYRILPLCDDELIRDTMADMEMAGVYPTPGYILEATPPASDGESDDSRYQLGHGRSKTMAELSGRFDGLGLGLGWAT